MTAIVDVNALQADGPTVDVLRTEPITDKWQAFGWYAVRVDGNDIEALGWVRGAQSSPWLAVGADLRHPCRLRRTAPRNPGEGALHARGRRRMANRPRPARGRLPRMNTTQTSPKLTTSAMIASFADPGQKTASAPFGHALARLADERPEIVGLSADLAKYTDMHIFRDAHPDRFFQIGMAEQAMLGAAAGMAEVGLVPFASTYAVFATRRAYDFLCLDIAEPALNVNVVGGLPGLTTGYGPSHQATEDLAILRGMPNLTIVDPCDSVDIEQAVPALAAHPGPTYMRLLRGKVPTVLDQYDYHFELGKAAELRTGRDVVLISTGLMTMRALTAAERLEADHVDVAVLHVPTIKPLDTQAILRAAADTDRLIVTLENHTIVVVSPNRWPPHSPSPEKAGASRPSACLMSSSPPALYPPCTTATDCLPTKSSLG